MIDFSVGDGNCLFRSIAEQLYGNCSLYGDVRAAVVRHIIANKDIFETSIEDDESFDDYVDRMRSKFCAHLRLADLLIL